MRWPVGSGSARGSPPLHRPLLPPPGTDQDQDPDHAVLHITTIPDTPSTSFCHPDQILTASQSDLLCPRPHCSRSDSTGTASSSSSGRRHKSSSGSNKPPHTSTHSNKKSGRSSSGISHSRTKSNRSRRGMASPSSGGSQDGPETVLVDSVDRSPNQITQRTQIQVTKRAGTVRSSWKLRYQDFIPTKINGKSSGSNGTQDSFSLLVSQANDWLRKNTEVTVRTAETIKWMHHDPKALGDSEQMLLCKSVAEKAKTYNCSGLRLWLSPRPSTQKSPPAAHSLHYKDIVPGQADSMTTLLHQFNKHLQNGDIVGRVVSVQTVAVPVVNGNVDGDVVRWAEDVRDDAPYAFCLRVFYNSEQKTPTCAGLRDFVPRAVEDGGYEGFAELTDRANTWLKDQSDVIVTNMQSVMVQKDGGPHSETGSACFFTMPGVGSQIQPEFFRILRVAYVKPPADDVYDVPVVYPFTYETFTPELIPPKDMRTHERLERLKETFARINTFLRNSGAEVICMETVVNPMQIFTESSAQKINPDEVKFLLTIRIFTNGQITHIDNNGRAQSRISGRRKSHEPSHNTHPGPIFLRSVVTRRYKYRWLVLAISVFTCMTIIVVVSVIYSNQ